MSINFNCTGCGTTYKVAEQYAGKKTTCRKCNRALTIPQASEESLDPPEISFADAEPASPPRMARPLSTPMYRREEPEEDDQGPPPLMAALPKVQRSDDVRPLDYRPAMAYGAPKNTRRPSQARNDEITKLFVILVFLAVIGSMAYDYISWPPAEVTAEFQKNQIPEDLISKIGRPHAMIILPKVAQLISIFGLLTPAILLSWKIAAAITKSTLPDDAYARCLGMACVPVVLGTIVALTPLGNDPMMRAAIMVAAVPIVWMMLSTVHGARGGEAALTMAFGTVTVTGALLLTLVLVGLAVGGSMVSYRSRVTAVTSEFVQQRNAQAAQKAADERQAKYDQERAAREEQQRQRYAAMGIRTTPRSSGESPAPAPAPAAPPEPGAFEAASLQIAVTRFQQAVSRGEKSRETLTEELQAARKLIEEGKARFPNRADWAAAEATLAGEEGKLSRVLSSKVDESIYAAVDAAEKWTFTPTTEREVSLGPVNFRTPVGARIVPTDNAATTLEFDFASGVGKVTAELLPVADEKQLRVWVRPSSTPAVDKVFSIEADRAPVVTIGQFGEIPFVRVVDSTERTSTTNRTRYVGKVNGQWLLFTAELGFRGETLPELLAASVGSCRLRPAGEAAVDPLSAAVLVADAAANGTTPALLKAIGAKKADAETEILKALDADSSDEPLKRYAKILPAVASEKSLKYLWKMAESKRPNSAEARVALATLDPKNADALKFISLDLAGDGETRKQAIAALAKAEVDAKRKPEISRGLIAALDDSSFMFFNRGEQLEVVLARWGNDLVFAMLAKSLGDEFGGMHSRGTAIGALSRTGNAKYAPVITRWVIKEPEAVVAGLKRMGAIGETEAMKLLNEKNADARKHAATILEEVGTGKSLAALARASKDQRDPVAAAAAQGAYEIVKARADAAKAAPGAATQPAAPGAAK